MWVRHAFAFFSVWAVFQLFLPSGGTIDGPIGDRALQLIGTLLGFAILIGITWLIGLLWRRYVR